MAIFNLSLQETYFKQGFFNVIVDFDRYVRTEEGPIELRLGRNGRGIQGSINRHANKNGTARIMGGADLRNWFQSQFVPMDTVAVDLSSRDIIILYKAMKSDRAGNS